MEHRVRPSSHVPSETLSSLDDFLEKVDEVFRTKFYTNLSLRQCKWTVDLPFSGRMLACGEYDPHYKCASFK